MMPCMCKNVVIFDLDDTLCKEIDFLKSAYRHIASLVSGESISEDDVYRMLWQAYQRGDNAFESVIRKYGFQLFTVQWMLNVYRNHKPRIVLCDEVKMTLEKLKSDDVILGIISDGRYIQQMNKIEALGLRDCIHENDIIINTDKEHIKPDLRSYKYFMDKYGDGCDFWYVGDNTAKDFIAPNSLGWTTVCLLDDGRNIHEQNFNLDDIYLPQYQIKQMKELPDLLRAI